MRVLVAWAFLAVGCGRMGFDPTATSDAAPARFVTLGPGAPLPSGAQCAAWVNASPTAETAAWNATQNAAMPTAEWLAAFYAHPDADLSQNGGAPETALIDGAYTGSTDMILRWAACKWGIDEDVVRGQAWLQSSWKQSWTVGSATGGDCTSKYVPSGALNYWTASSPCRDLRGLYGVSLTYFNTYPYSDMSTALNADYRWARQRTCMNGGVPWYVGSAAADWGAYPPTETSSALYGCIDAWISGGWNSDANSSGYVANLMQVIATHPWP
jgi:autotransporter family porin